MKKFVSIFSNLAFICLFPGFFFWHLGIASGYIPIEIGFYGEVSAVTAFLFLTLFAYRWVNLLYKSSFSFVTFLFLLYCFLWTIGNIAFGSPPPGTVAQIGASFLLFFALLSVGAFMNIGQAVFRRTLVLSFVGMIAIALWFSKGFSFDLALTFDAEAGVASYQGLSRSTTITSIVLLSYMEKTWKRLLFSALAVISAFLMEARSELFGLLFSIIVFHSVIALKNVKSMLPFILTSACFIIFAAINIALIADSRQFEVLDLARSTSWSERLQLSEFAWRQISEHPIMGVFGGHYYANDKGDLGSYAHNILSAWVSFGFFGFAMYLALASWAFIASIIGFARSSTPLWRLSLYLNAFSFILIIFAKEFLWATIALGWGTYIQVSNSSTRPASRPVQRRPFSRRVLAQ